ncbi:MAG: hypothetical protein IT240_03830, partial [Bacteroidia bacterium]|nr:hypothetical protein [Bacteroidia bacterium]
MTLSVLIPIYQEDVNALVNELFIQLSSSNISFEIRCLDDHSDKKYRELNSQVVQDKRIEIHYRELGTN